MFHYPLSNFLPRRILQVPPHPFPAEFLDGTCHLLSHFLVSTHALAHCLWLLPESPTESSFTCSAMTDNDPGARHNGCFLVLTSLEIGIIGYCSSSKVTHPLSSEKTSLPTSLLALWGGLIDLRPHVLWSGARGLLLCLCRSCPLARSLLCLLCPWDLGSPEYSCLGNLDLFNVT